MYGVCDIKQRNTGYGSATSTMANSANHITYPSSPSSATSNNNNNNPEGAKPKSSVFCLHGQRHIEVRDHCHRQRSEGVDVKARRKLLIASGLCLFFMICEIVGGIWSNSLAIATDAAHLLTDFASFMISLFAIWIAGRPSTQRMSFGWYRAEVIGALASVVMIWFITAILVWLAIQRVINQDFELNAPVMLITSGLAILVNLIMGVQLQHGHSHGGGLGHGHSHGGKDKKKKGKKSKNHITDMTLTPTQNNGVVARTNGNHSHVVCPTPPTEVLETGVSPDAELPSAGLGTFSYQNSHSVNEVRAEMTAVMAETSVGTHHHGGEAAKEAQNMNVRAAYIHVLGDMVQSVGVFIAALVIYFKPEWSLADPICTFVFSIIVLFTTFAIIKDALLVLMEGTPSYLHYAEVLNIFQQIEGVQRVHNLRIWALSINKVALSVHLAIAEGAEPKKIMQEATTAVHMRYNFFETTIQIEDFTPEMETCTQCTVPEV
ncbi:proton-coupled zinc antiporter SLC30A2 isoform X2 [Stomoxys calcitrans]|uniref:proton-coupled zinc antiporter SLC30A2 isoform X2 n=1 Tax=Stomoxys calcitrans TaxID=35570 RepID=UPI0027E27B58|nr:proton-coupled zinc antiporter SLC30A2 isoform X2 [Stomoxys calcitrans]